MYFIGSYRGVGGVVSGPTLNHGAGVVHGEAPCSSKSRLGEWSGGQAEGLLGVPDSPRQRSREGGVHVHQKGAQRGSQLSPYGPHLGPPLLPDCKASDGRNAGPFRASRDRGQCCCQPLVIVRIPGTAKGVVEVARGLIPDAQAVLL